MNGIQGLLHQFGSMMTMLKNGGNPMQMMQNMMGNSNSDLSRAIQEAQRLQGERGSQGFEDLVRSEFKKAGLDISEVRRTLGI